MNTVLSKLILFCVLLLFCFKVHAANYYFSDKIGNDSRSSSQAQNPDTPWKSIGKINAIFPALNPGDKIFLRRGEVFAGEIILTNSGSSGKPIIIGAYGNGAKPIITSMVPLSNWKSNGGGIFETSHPDLDIDELNIVLIDNEKQEMGRYPNSDASNKGYLTYESSSGNRSLTSNSLNSSPNWAGAEVVVRKTFWIIDRHRITSHNGNTVNYAPNPDSSYEPTPNYGFFIQNNIKTLDQLGEWFYDASSKKFLMFFGSSTPNDHFVEASTGDQLVTNSKTVSFIVFENLHFRGANKNIVFLEGGDNIKILGCDIEYGGDNGLFINGVSDFELSKSKVIGSGNNGILLGTSENAIIKNNLVKDTYLLPGLTRGGDGKGISIFASSDNNLVEGNQVINSGYIGIRFSGNKTIVHNNLVDNFCLTKNDGGGIYSYSGKSDNFNGRKVTNNIILNGKGVKEGTNLQNHLSFPQVEGIYLDDNVTGVEVLGNTVAHVTSRGIYLHNTDKIILKGNLVYDSRDLFYAKNDHMGNPLRNTLVEENFFITKDAFQNQMALYSNANDIGNFGRFNKNYYASPTTDGFRFKTNIKQSSATEEQTFDLKGWQSSKNWERDATFSPYTVSPYKVKEIKGSNKYDNQKFSSHVRNVGCNNCNTSWDNSGMLDGGALKVSFSDHGLLSMGIGALKEGKKYLMKFSTKGNKITPLTAYVRQSGSPWQRISGLHTIEVSTNRQEHELLFSPVADMEISRVEFRLSQKIDADVWIDNLEFFEVSHEEIRQEEFLLFEFNATNSAKTIPLNGEYVNAKNEKFSKRITLEPFTSMVLLKTSELSQESEPEYQPKIQIVSPSNNSEFKIGEEIEIKVNAGLTNGVITRVDFFNDGKWIGSSETAPFSYIWKDVKEEEIKLSAEAFGDNGLKKTSELVLASILPTSPVEEDNQPDEDHGNFNLLINIGSKLSTRLLDISFEGESSSKSFHNSSKTHINENSSSSVLFQSERFSENLKYKIPLPNGTYRIQTLHNETYFGKNGPSKRSGRRVFDILIEGKTVKQNLDLFEESDNNPLVLTFDEIKVSDGVLDIALNSSVNNATLSGLVVQDISLPVLNFNLEQASSPEITIPQLDPPNDDLSGALLMNVGSNIAVNFLGHRFEGDDEGKYFTGSRVFVNSMASDMKLLQTERVGKTMELNIPLPKGNYRIITYHNELYFGTNGRGPEARAGRRVFDIMMEGTTVKKDFDIFLENDNHPTTLTFDDISISDGILDISMKASSDHATLSGIAIIPLNTSIEKPAQTSQPIFLNAGSNNNTTFEKSEFIGDASKNFHNSSKTNTNTSVSPIKLFETERYASKLSYTIPVANGFYTVFTYHNELWFGSYGPSAQPGRRVFDISIEGELVKSNFDLFLENRNQPLVLTFKNVEVKDGKLNIDLEASVNNATLSGLAIIPNNSEYLIPSSNLRVMPDDREKMTLLQGNSMDAEYTKSSVRIFPNPASWKANLKFDREVSFEMVSIHTTNGQLVKLVYLNDVRQENNLFSIPINDLKNGIYLLTLQGGDRPVERLKLVVKQ